MTRILYARGFHVSAFRDRYPRNSLPSQLNLSLSKTDDEAQSHEMDSNSRPPSYRSRREREDNIESRAAESTHNATMRNASTNTEPTVSTGTSDALAGRTAAPATQTPNKEDVDLNVAEYILGVAFILAMAELCAFVAFFLTSITPCGLPNIPESSSPCFPLAITGSCRAACSP